MTDALMEEIYAIARESFLGGNDSFAVHAFPFRMTDDNMRRHASHPYAPFWATLKEGYDYFEVSRQLPNIGVCNKRYVVNVTLRNGDVPKGLDPVAACPPFVRPKVVQYVPPPGEVPGQGQVVVPGPKHHNLEGNDPTTRSGLLNAAGRNKPEPRMSLAPTY